jgi:uncharacterized protein (TIGR03083 family)
VDRSAVLAGLDACWEHLLALGEELTDQDWERPTRCPGWRVKDLYAHVVGTESMLLGRRPPEVEVRERPHVRNDIGAFNEAWVVALESRSRAELLNLIREVIAERRAALSALSDDAWEEVGFTPAGQDTHGRFMRIRVFDQWMHEQDARAAVGRPGHVVGPAVTLSLEEAGASLGYVVGKRAGAPAGTGVRIEVTGPTTRRYDLDVAERASVVEDLGRDPDVELRIPLEAFVALIGGRDDAERARAVVEVRGDEDLARRILDNLGYMI